MVYRKRPDEPSDKRPLLDAMGRFRKVVIENSSALRAGSPVYLALGEVTSAVDEVARLLTGNDAYYHASGSAQGSDFSKWRDSGR